MSDVALLERAGAALATRAAPATADELRVEAECETSRVVSQLAEAAESLRVEQTRLEGEVVARRARLEALLELERGLKEPRERIREECAARPLVPAESASDWRSSVVRALGDFVAERYTNNASLWSKIYAALDNDGLVLNADLDCVDAKRLLDFGALVLEGSGDAALVFP